VSPFITYDQLLGELEQLPWAEGRVPTPNGPVLAAWRQGTSGAKSFEMEVRAPRGSTYTAGVPVMNGTSVSANGRLIWADGHATTAA
jgi:Bacterial alpha-L-rhamnosidase C-terminal domain